MNPFWFALLAAVVGPPRGSLVVVGGGNIGPEIAERFVSLAGGPEAAFVVIPTAAQGRELNLDLVREDFTKQFGVKHVAVLHTRDRVRADSAEFTAPLRRARAVWFTGGRQWRIVDAYLGTRTEREIRAVLSRGGVIGGTSAGATIQGSYLVRGAVQNNEIMMARGHERGFGYLRNVAIDQHLLKRHRESDLVPVVARFPRLLGIGIDESTAIVVDGDRFEVIGASKVAVYDGRDHEGRHYYFLSPGDCFDLAARRKISP